VQQRLALVGQGRDLRGFEPAGLLLDPPGQQERAGQPGQGGQGEQEGDLGYVGDQGRPRGRIGLADERQPDRGRIRGPRGGEDRGAGHDQLVAGQGQVTVPGPPVPVPLVRQGQPAADQRRVGRGHDGVIQVGDQDDGGARLDADGLDDGREVGCGGRRVDAVADGRIGRQALRRAQNPVRGAGPELGLGLPGGHTGGDDEDQGDDGQLEDQELAGQRVRQPATHQASLLARIWGGGSVVAL
jgi:hypothetical protein